MAKGGSRQGRENNMAQIAGAVAAIIGDYAYIALRIPWYNTPSAIRDFTLGDIVQMGGATLLTLLGFTKGNSRLAPFGFGALAAQVASKVIFPSFGYDRYILFDIDSRGRLYLLKDSPKCKCK